MDNESITKEGPLDPQETETPSESLPETNHTESSESSAEETKPDVKAVPFNEDPKIQDYINRQVKNKLDEELQTRFSTPKEEEKTPSWWNGDVEGYKQFENDVIGKAEQRALEKIEAKREAETKRIQEANEWFETSVAEIEATGHKVDKNLLLKTAMDLELVDTKGRWNYKAAAKLLERDVDTSALDAKKRAASVTVSESKAEGTPATYRVPRIFRR